MISRESIQSDEHVTDQESKAGTPQEYVQPKLERMQKLAQVTGQVVMTGPV